MKLAHSISAALLASVLAGAAHATNVNVVGLSANKAILSIDGGAPRTVGVGQRTAEGVLVVAIDSDTATIEIDGKRRSMKMGQLYQSAAASSAQRVTLKADGRGHFVTEGRVNGGQVRFLVDTGATLISLPASDARRLGVNYINAPKGFVQTANGNTVAYKVKLDSVSIRGVTVNNVDAVVLDGGLEVALLGMTFLNRMEMKRDGDTMVLTKRF